jgi:hypothetical protein
MFTGAGSVRTHTYFCLENVYSLPIASDLRDVKAV